MDVFCEHSLKNAMTQERRRYGFVLERQCSLAKHWTAYHTFGKETIENSLENWVEVASTREFLPPNMENVYKNKIRDMNEDDSDRLSITSALRKSRSIDASCLDMRSIGDLQQQQQSNGKHIARAKSEYNLTTTSNMTSIAATTPENRNWDQRPIAIALYAYLSSGENQLSFLESDKIALVGERAKGWQFGENLRTQSFGWFPLAYTEMESSDDNHSTSNWESKPQRKEQREHTPDSSLESTLIDEHTPKKNNYNSHQEESSPTRMFGDTIMYRHSKQVSRIYVSLVILGTISSGDLV